MLGIGNVIDPLPRLLEVSSLTDITDNYVTQETEIQNFYDRVNSDMITKAIEGSITNISI